MAESPRALLPRPRLLVPVLSVTDRLRTRSRLLTLVGLLLVPSLLAAGSLAMVIGGQVAFAQSERAGVRVVAPAVQALAASAAGADPDLRTLRAAVAAHPGLTADRELAAVEGARDGAARATALHALVTSVGDRSKLILDPDLDSFYVMDALVVQLPRSLAALGAPVPDSDGTPTTRRALQAGLLTVAAEQLEDDVATAVRHTAAPALQQELQPVLEASRRLSVLAGGWRLQVAAGRAAEAAASQLDVLLELRCSSCLLYTSPSPRD